MGDLKGSGECFEEALKIDKYYFEVFIGKFSMYLFFNKKLDGYEELRSA